MQHVPDTPLTPRQRQYLLALLIYQRARGHPPTLVELNRMLGTTSLNALKQACGLPKLYARGALDVNTNGKGAARCYRGRGSILVLPHGGSAKATALTPSEADALLSRIPVVEMCGDAMTCEEFRRRCDPDVFLALTPEGRLETAAHHASCQCCSDWFEARKPAGELDPETEDAATLMGKVMCAADRLVAAARSRTECN